MTKDEVGPGPSGTAKTAAPAQSAEPPGAIAYSRAVAVSPCCGVVDMEAPVVRRSFDLPLDAAGQPLRAGDPGDIYTIGNEPRGAGQQPDTRPLRLQLPSPEALAFDLTGRLPALRAIRFPLLGDAADAQLAAAVDALLRARYGQSATLTRLGRGGHQLAMRVCSQSGCVVAKLRRLERIAAGRDVVAMAEDAADAMRRDLVMLIAADAIFHGERWLAADGTPMPMAIAGEKITPPAASSAVTGQLARVARLTDPRALSVGLVEMELVPWRAGSVLTAMLAGNVGAQGATREALWSQAEPAGVSRVLAMAFADRYQSPSDLGPELIKLRGFVDDCQRLSKLPAVAHICRQAAQDFRLVDDLAARIAALEEVYRQSTPLILRLVRQQLGRSIANDRAGGQPVEVGLDLNHGRNVGWDPETCQFVIFDA